MHSVVATKTFDISQVCVATHSRCGGIFSDSFITKCTPDSVSEINVKIGQHLMKLKRTKRVPLLVSPNADYYECDKI